ncbi:hypothetical protein EBME_0301 [bacterium endosymbiont of Mortierella elongata FMR23-6]|nr:hypothetical protein EBME_0301 [bacterium endosymbiont of Mortierella elongata FMR23-6]
MANQEGTVVQPTSWTLHNAIPLKFSETNFDASSDKVIVIRSLKLQVDSYTVGKIA